MVRERERRGGRGGEKGGGGEELNSPKSAENPQFFSPHFWTFWRSALRADHPTYPQNFLGAFGANFYEK